VRVHLRDVERLDDVADVTAPAPVEPGDLVSTALNREDLDRLRRDLTPPRTAGLRLEHEWQPEAREELGIDERRDLADPLALERDDVDRSRLPPSRLLVDLEVRDRRLAIGADGNRS
jgi:hypothetical protein